MENNNCNLPVEYSVPWAGNFVDFCRYHTVGLVNVAKAIGAPVQVRKIETGALCTSKDKLDDETKARIDANLKEMGL